MVNKTQLEQWLSQLTTQHIVLGYGSLLSHHSRKVYSGIDVPSIEVSVQGFTRSWITRAWHENQTYVGATPAAGKWLNAQLVPTELNPALRERERDYRFVEVSAEQVALIGNDDPLAASLEGFTLWLCESLDTYHADDDFPVHRSYVDTCLSGCFEAGGDQSVKRFLATTLHWPKQGVLDDRTAPKYPRAANVEAATASSIDALIQEFMQCQNPH